MKKFLLLLTILLPVSLWSQQILDISPVFPTQNDTVTIIYDATAGNGALSGIGPVYAHTGVITNLSNSPTDWRHVQGTWGTADPIVLMTSLGNDLHEIKYHIDTYYSVPGNETVNRLAFVFRDAQGNNVGRASDGSDIFYPVYPAGQLFAAILTPNNNLVVNPGDNFDVRFAASDSATLTLTDNGSQLYSAFQKDVTINVNASGSGPHELILTADDGVTSVSDTINYTVNPTVQFVALPANTKQGINYTSSSSVRLYLPSPGKTTAYVIGSFNNYQADTAYFMNRTPDNNGFWIDINGLTPGQQYTYQYLIDGNIVVADPFSELVLDPNNDQWVPSVTFPNMPPYPTGLTDGIVTVLEPGKPAYQWQNNNFTPAAEEDLVVYELLIRDFVARHDYETMIDTLDYLERLGINAIELMPIQEFEGNDSWGYNPSFHMAVDKYYGTGDKLKEFIDECHGRGIAVILDVVYNHAFSQSPLCQMWWNSADFKPSSDNPYLNEDARHPFNVGYDFNHESTWTRSWVKRTIEHWLVDYRFDGFRFDLSKGFTQTNSGNDVGFWGQYDASRIAILKDYFDYSRSLNSSAHLILEHFGDNSEETELANYGFMFWGNLGDPYNEATMGYTGNSDFSWISYQNRGWNAPRVVGYMESHDEERLPHKNIAFGNSSGPYNVRDTITSVARMEAAGALFFTIPGPKMIWQWGELGYDVAYAVPCQLCPKPILWNYYQQPERRYLYQVWRALINLKTTYPAFRTNNFQLDVGGGVKRVTLNHPNLNVNVVGNFEVTDQFPTVSFPQNGRWYEYFTGDSIDVTNNNYGMVLAPGEYRLYTDVRLPAPDLSIITAADDPLEANELAMELWPNPSEGIARLGYQVDGPAEVTIEVYDVLGRKVADLGTETQGFGYHTVELDGQAWGKGRYIVRVTAGERQGWRMMDIQ